MKFAYYPGCSLSATGIEYNMSTKAVAKAMGVELWEIPEWNCCGASAAHLTNHHLSLALPARNLAIAEKEGLDVAVPCAACYARLKSTEMAVRESAATKQEVNEIIEMEYNAVINVKPMLDVFVNQVGLDAIKALVNKPLEGLKVAAYYGCLLVKPPKVVEFDDPEHPQSMDRLVNALGGTAVEWGYKTECCGAGHPTTVPEVGFKMVNDILHFAKAEGAECIVTACPLCLVNLDFRQAQVEKQYGVNYEIPVFYFTELMGLAMGLSLKELGIDRHFVNAVGLLDVKGLLKQSAARRAGA